MTTRGRGNPDRRDAHTRLWTDVVRRAEQPYVPPAASLLAFTAWQCGNGALSNVALDRALEADPGYSMARLLRDIIDAGTPTAAVDWAGAICALESGRCHAPPC